VLISRTVAHKIHYDIHPVVLVTVRVRHYGRGDVRTYNVNYYISSDIVLKKVLPNRLGTEGRGWQACREGERSGSEAVTGAWVVRVVSIFGVF
jgi:hypothetical protein